MNPTPRRKLLTRILALVILGLLVAVAFFVLKSVTSTQRTEKPSDNATQATPSSSDAVATTSTPSSHFSVLGLEGFLASSRSLY